MPSSENASGKFENVVSPMRIIGLPIQRNLGKRMWGFVGGKRKVEGEMSLGLPLLKIFMGREQDRKDKQE